MEKVGIEKKFLEQLIALGYAMERQLKDNNKSTCSLPCDHNTLKRPQIERDNEKLADMWRELAHSLEEALEEGE